jgi:FKBP-type peptidyl-prolyl cis-trans isomerase
MFSKIEIAGIALSVTVMTGALYLATKTDTVTETPELGKTNEIGKVFVKNEGDETANLRKAIVGAADGAGNLNKLIVDDVVLGNGDEVKSGDTVTVHYVGTLQNGQEFDNSNKRGTPFTFTVGEGKVIKGWEEGIVGMKKGGKRILVIPSDLGYGANGYGPIPGGASLVFAIDLIDIKTTEAKS